VCFRSMKVQTSTDAHSLNGNFCCWSTWTVYVQTIWRVDNTSSTHPRCIQIVFNNDMVIYLEYGGYRVQKVENTNPDRGAKTNINNTKWWAANISSTHVRWIERCINNCPLIMWLNTSMLSCWKCFWWWLLTTQCTQCLVYFTYVDRHFI
jgi:hypothetical protein